MPNSFLNGRHRPRQSISIILQIYFINLQSGRRVHVFFLCVCVLCIFVSLNLFFSSSAKHTCILLHLVAIEVAFESIESRLAIRSHFPQIPKCQCFRSIISGHYPPPSSTQHNYKRRIGRKVVARKQNCCSCRSAIQCFFLIRIFVSALLHPPSFHPQL